VASGAPLAAAAAAKARSSAARRRGAPERAIIELVSPGVQLQREWCGLVGWISGWLCFVMTNMCVVI
jgi:hypothetical protein